jgi:hypothetical protein
MYKWKVFRVNKDGELRSFISFYPHEMRMWKPYGHKTGKPKYAKRDCRYAIFERGKTAEAKHPQIGIHVFNYQWEAIDFVRGSLIDSYYDYCIGKVEIPKDAEEMSIAIGGLRSCGARAYSKVHIPEDMRLKIIETYPR